MWQKKNQQYKGRNHNYSFINNLKKQKKITDEFEVMLSSLTLEEVMNIREFKNLLKKYDLELDKK